MALTSILLRNAYRATRPVNSLKFFISKCNYYYPENGVTRIYTTKAINWDLAIVSQRIVQSRLFSTSSKDTEKGGGDVKGDSKQPPEEAAAKGPCEDENIINQGKCPPPRPPDEDFKDIKPSGSYQKVWMVEKLISAALLVAIPVGFINPSKTIDLVVASLIVFHAHKGLHGVITDYLTVEMVGPFFSKLSEILLYAISGLILIGVYYFGQRNDMAIGCAIRKFWKLQPGGGTEWEKEEYQVTGDMKDCGGPGDRLSKPAVSRDTTKLGQPPDKLDEDDLVAPEKQSDKKCD